MAEDAFLEELSHWSDAGALIEVVEAAVAAKRIQLAARIAGLLEGHLDIEPGSPLEKAVRAASFLLLRRSTPAENSWAELDEAMNQLRQERFVRAKRRMRRNSRQDAGDFLGLVGHSAKRRKR
jgi:hypothetical protein